MNGTPAPTTKRGSIAAPIVCSLLLLLPPLLLLYYISVFGVNVIYFDEWGMVTVIQHAMSRSLSFSDLFFQHNEHRIPIPKLAILALESLTRYNTVTEMLFGWTLLCLSALLIFNIYRTRFASSNYPKLLLIYWPVSFLFFSFRQLESILWGFVAVVFYLTVFGVVAAFTFLAVSKSIDLWFVLGLLCATLASFSSAAGLMVWLVGPIQILIQGKKDVWKAVVWCVVGMLTFAVYLNGYYYQPPGSPPLTHIFTDPLDAAWYFFVLIGAPFSFDIANAGAFGLVTALIAVIVLTIAYRGRILGSNAIWLSLVLFATLFSLVTVVGRSGLGVPTAIASRYTSITGLGIIGLYVLAFSVSEKLFIKGKSFGFHALLALILVAVIVSYNGGWQAGPYVKYSREMEAYILRTYKIQSDENIRNYMFPREEIVREGAKFLEQNTLNVFGEQVIDPSTLVLVPSDALYAMDTINGRSIPQQNSSFVIDSRQQETITIIGWAADKQSNDLASAVFVNIDGSLAIPSLYGLDRADVAIVFGNKNFRFSGYVATFASSILSKGEHEMSLKIVSKDGSHYYSVERLLHLIVN